MIQREGDGADRLYGEGRSGRDLDRREEGMEFVREFESRIGKERGEKRGGRQLRSISKGVVLSCRREKELASRVHRNGSRKGSLQVRVRKGRGDRRKDACLELIPSTLRWRNFFQVSAIFLVK